MEKKYGYLLVFLLLVMTLGVGVVIYFYYYPLPLLAPSDEAESIQRKEISVEVGDDGVSTQRILWRVGVPERLSLISPGEWGISIPAGAKSIEVEDKNGRIEHWLEGSEDESYKMLKFENPENIRYGSDYYFDISYMTEHVVYEPYHFYEQTFTRFDTDNDFSLMIELPEGSEIVTVTREPVEQFVQDGKSIVRYDFEKGESDTIGLDLEILGQELPELDVVGSKYFEVTLPKRYAEKYRSEVLDEADEMVGFMGELYGFSSPNEKWRVEIVGGQGEKFEKRLRGFYLGNGSIELHAATQFQNRKEALVILSHEVAHGFNDAIFGEVGLNNWLNEGMAVFASLYVLEQIGHDVSEIRESYVELLESCGNYDKGFIARWSPNVLITFIQTASLRDIYCEGGVTDQVSLGYAQSYKIVADLAGFGVEKVFGGLRITVEELGVEFSSDREEFNNQANFVFSAVVGEDLTDFFELRGIEVSAPETGVITGKPIFLGGEKNVIAGWIVLIIIAGVVIFFIIRNIRKGRK